MVQLVRLHQPFGIAAFGDIFEIALVDQAIVDQSVDDAVEQYAKADPCARLPRIRPHDQRAADGEHRDAHRRADQPEKIILFQALVMRLVMVAMPAPAEAVHDIFVARPGDKFHRDDRGQYGSEDRKNAHSAKIGALTRVLKAILTCAGD